MAGHAYNKHIAYIARMVQNGPEFTIQNLQPKTNDDEFVRSTFSHPLDP